MKLNPQNLPEFLQKLITTPPLAGEGVHIWLYRVSRQLHAHLPAGEIIELLERAVADCGRPVPRDEIISAVQNSLPTAWQPKGKAAPTVTKWPGLNKEQRKTILRDGCGLADLWELSYPRIEDNAPHTEEVIDRLFPDNPLLCCGKSQRSFDTKPRENWRGLMSQLQFIVPSPMSAVTGLTKEGNESKHSLANTGARRFLICEFDKGTTDEQAGLLLHLGGIAPLACAVHSGGKSLHGWFYVHGQPETKVEKFFRYAISLGADPAAWTPSQFVRMPDGTRDNGRRQTVFFLNFKPLATKL